jgi:predicted ATP-binding protein involved in virulence
MRLEQLKIENFRGFESLTLDFHPEVTVLVGANGSGKTTVLEAIMLVLANLLTPRKVLQTVEGIRAMLPTDYRSGTVGASVSLGLEYEGNTAVIESTLDVKREDSGRYKEITQLYRAGDLDGYYEDSESKSAVPIACYYDVERHAHDSTPRSRDPVFRKPIDAWNDAWNARAGFHELFQWFRELEDMENAERVKAPESRDHQLDAARRAIESLPPGYSSPHVYRARASELVGINRPVLAVEKAGQMLAFDQLSHGERLLVALAGDIARRLAIANPESKNPLLGEGIVLIDEPDLHLHPEWQAKVIPALRRTFPNVQLVVTTHSLIVLSYVPSECVRLLENFEVFDSPTHTEGREPNALASEVYGIPLRPPEVEAELHRIAVLIDAERYDEARAGLEALSEKLGDTDTGIVGLQTALALEDI